MRPARWRRRCRAARRIALLVTGDQLGVVEVVARIHPHAFRQAAAHGDLLLLRQERDLDAVDLGGMVAE